MKKIFFSFVVGTRAARRTVTIVLVLGLFLQLSGYAYFALGANIIFAESGSILTPTQSSLLIALIGFIPKFFDILMVDRIGRKPLLIFSLCVSAFGIFTLSLHHLFKNQLTEYKWIPLVTMMFIVFIQNIGTVPLPFIIVLDILPIKVKLLKTSTK